MTPRRAVLVLLAVPFLLFMTGESAEHGAEGSGMLGKVVNFAILFGALFFLLRKPLGAMLVQRTEDIRTSIEDAGRGKAGAEAKLIEARARLADLSGEVARMKAKAEEDVAAESERLRALAASEAARIKALAAQDIEARFKAGVRELKAFAAELAAGLAESRIKARMTDDLQSALIDRSIESLGTLHEESSSR
jgi:F-type H+-transporting ATPase subunit b